MGCAKLTYGYTSARRGVRLERGAPHPDAGARVQEVEKLVLGASLGWSLATGTQWSTELNTGKNRLVATAENQKS